MLALRIAGSPPEQACDPLRILPAPGFTFSLEVCVLALCLARHFVRSATGFKLFFAARPTAFLPGTGRGLWFAVFIIQAAMAGSWFTNLVCITLPTPIDMLGRHGRMCFGQVHRSHTAFPVGCGLRTCDGLACSFTFITLRAGNDGDSFFGTINLPAGIRDCLINKTSDKRYNHAGYEYRYVS